MDDVRGDFLGPPHGITPAAVIANKNKTEILKESEKPELESMTLVVQGKWLNHCNTDVPRFKTYMGNVHVC